VLRLRRPNTARMSTAPIVSASPAEFVARTIVFGTLVIVGIAAIVVAGSWWAACIAAAGLLFAVAGLVVTVLALLSERQAAAWRASRPVALALGAFSVAAVVAALAVA
jgi:hypothetical protein